MEPMEPHDLIHIYFVYAKEDYDTFIDFLGWFKEILRTLEHGDTVTYETQDSELFPEQQDDNICDICERAIYILPFLSPSFCSNKRLRFFTSEAIGKTRLQSICPKGALENSINKQKKYAVRPIHTADPRSGTYRIPTGLTMMKGIEYYSKDKHVGYVKNQVTGIIKDAIRKFDERKAAMANALTGIDLIPEIVEESIKKKFGSPPTEHGIGIILHKNSNALALVQNGYGVQEKQVGNLGKGEYLTLTTESMAAEADGNTSMTDSASLYTQGYKQLYDATALTNGETKLSQTIKTSEGETVNLLAEGKYDCIDDSTGFSLASSHNDTSLEIDNGSLNKNTVRNATQKAAKGQDQDSIDRALNVGLGVRVSKDSGKGVRTNYMSYTGPAVPNNTEGKPINGQKIRKSAKKNTAYINETKCNDTSSTTQNSESETSWRLTDESYSENRTKMMTNGDTVSKEFDNPDIENDAALFADNIPSDFSRKSQNAKYSSQAVKVEEHDEELEQPESDTDSYLGFLGCTIDSHEPVLRLCKITMNRYGSIDSGYHTNFSQIYKTSLTPQLRAEQDDDEVD